MSATTGYDLGTVASQALGVWTNPNNALVESDTVANFTTTTKNDNRILELQTFGFNAQIPATATIVQVNLKCRTDRTSGGTTTIYPRINTTDGTANTPANAALATDTYSAIPRPGGGSWTRADLLDGVFTVRFNALQPNNTTSRTYEIAWAEVEVIYNTDYEGVLENYKSVKSVSAGIMSVGERIK